jgi:hypothetical protein
VMGARAGGHNVRIENVDTDRTHSPATASVGRRDTFPAALRVPAPRQPHIRSTPRHPTQTPGMPPGRPRGIPHLCARART